MEISEVHDRKTVRQFLELPVFIYREDPNWIRPLDKDIEFVFDREKNKFWKHGEAQRWILRNEKGEAIGRIAAFINHRINKNSDEKVGGMGFFECIDDQVAANKLFDQAANWLREKGIQLMEGPINFGERDSWWGLLVDGFTEPTYQMNYHRPYYQKLFEQYGFKLYYRQFVLYRNILDPVQEKFTQKYKELMQDSGYRFDHVQKSELRKYAKDFMEVLNKAWGGFEGFKEMQEGQAFNIMKKLKPILAEEIAWFGYYKDNPIAFFIMIPDLNQIIKHFNGRFGWIEKLRLIWMLRRRKTNRCYGILFGVVPEHQGKGVEGAIVEAASHVIHPLNHWGPMEMIWIGDFNPKMLHVAKSVGGEISKTYHTYRVALYPDIEVKRHPYYDQPSGPEYVHVTEYELKKKGQIIPMQIIDGQHVAI